MCAPSLFQRIVPKCIGKTADISIYKKNRDILCDALGKYGYKVAQPDGAFYLFVKALEENGIGRPSTYAAIIETIVSRNYVKREKKTLVPTQLGEVTTKLMKESFDFLNNHPVNIERAKKGLKKEKTGQKLPCFFFLPLLFFFFSVILFASK